MINREQCQKKKVETKEHTTMENIFYKQFTLCHDSQLCMAQCS